MALKDLLQAGPPASLEGVSESSTTDSVPADDVVGNPEQDDQVEAPSSEATTPLDQGAVTSEARAGLQPAAKSSVVADTAVSLESSKADNGQLSEADSAKVAESQIPKGISEVVTPSGISIYFQAYPKRLYKVNGKEVPSVTTVLDILEKGGLSWWGQRIGVLGLQALMKMPEYDDNWSEVHIDTIVGNKDKGIKGLLTHHSLTVNHVRDAAGDRGQSVHDALEVWATNGVMPQVAVYAPEEQGYVQALSDFLVDSGAEAIASEVMVGSAKHKYAGRFDLRAAIPQNADVVVKTYPKRKPLRGPFMGGEWLLDLKTSKGVYDTHYLQLEAYEEASKECGYEPTVNRGVIHVTEDGRYELAISKATFTDFKAVLGAYKRLERLKAR